MKILVIEDYPAELRLAHHVLSAAGHDVADADAAEQAFEKIREDRPDVILLDMNLPGMDGLTLARKLKSHPETHNIHIVAVSSYPERYPKNEVLRAGCDAFLTKPLSTRTLPQQLSDIVCKPERRE
jgi:CheY-like chemotaxis protein